MIQTQRPSGARSPRVLATLVLAVASAGAGFAIGRHPEIGKGVQAAALPPASLLGNGVAPYHDGSMPDATDSLQKQKGPDGESAPTF